MPSEYRDRGGAVTAGVLRRDVGIMAATPRPVKMPLTGIFLFIYVVSLVLFTEYTSTVLITTGAAVALTAVFVVEMLRRGVHLSVPHPLIWFAVFLSYCSFQMIFIPGSTETLLTLYQLLLFSIIVVTYGSLDRDRLAYEYGIYFGVICTFVYNIVAQPPKVDGRIGSTLVNANAYSLLLMIGVLLALRRILLIVLEGRLTWRASLAFTAYFALSMYGIVYLAGSRKAIILTLGTTAFLVLYCLWKQPIKRRIWLSLAVVVLFASLGYILYRSPQFSRITDLSGYVTGRSAKDTGLLMRSEMLRDAFHLWAQRPLTGYGLDQFRVYSGWGTYSHDNYMELLVNTGLFGLLLYLGVFASAFLSLVRSLRHTRDQLLWAEAFWGLLVLLAMLGWDLGAVSYYEKFNWILLIAVIISTVRLKSARRPLPAKNQ